MGRYLGLSIILHGLMNIDYFSREKRVSLNGSASVMLLKDVQTEGFREQILEIHAHRAGGIPKCLVHGIHNVAAMEV